MLRCVYLSLLIAFLAHGFCQDPSCYLKGKLPKNDKRYATFYYVLEKLSQRKGQVMVETGTSRKGRENCLGDGCSTCIFSKWAYDNGATLFSIDISAQALKNAEQCLGEERHCVHFVHSDSVEYLKTFEHPIDFLYLDSYDFQVKRYFASQLHHLHEIEAALPYLHDNSIVMIDDCDLPHGGKGELVIQFLKLHGWKVSMRGYQVVMEKNQ